jgi:hypothetical protein
MNIKLKLPKKFVKELREIKQNRDQMVKDDLEELGIESL